MKGGTFKLGVWATSSWEFVKREFIEVLGREVVRSFFYHVYKSNDWPPAPHPTGGHSPPSGVLHCQVCGFVAWATGAGVVVRRRDPTSDGTQPRAP